MGRPFLGGLGLTERVMGEENVLFIGVVLNGCSVNVVIR